MLAVGAKRLRSVDMEMIKVKFKAIETLLLKLSLLEANLQKSDKKARKINLRKL